MTPKQEIALGLQAARQMIEQYGGLYPNQQYQDIVDRIGMSLVRNSKAAETEYQYEFHLLNDRQTVNAFALRADKFLLLRHFLEDWKLKRN